MQLAQILRQAGPRLWVLALVPAIALGVAAFLVTLQPQGSHVVATVGVTSPTGSSTAATVTQNVDSFRSALTTQAVRDAAADAAGVAGVPEGNVSSDRVGASNLVDIEVTARNRETLDAVVPALVENANDLLFTPTINAAEADREAAQEDFDALQQRVAETSEKGLVIPSERYRAKASEVTQLRVALASARARGVSGEASGLSDALATASRELRRLEDTVNGLERLSFDYDRALTRLADAEALVSSTESRLVAANDATTIKLGDVRQDSASTVYARAAVAALVVGLAVALGLVLLIGALRRGGSSTA